MSLNYIQQIKALHFGIMSPEEVEEKFGSGS